MHFKREQTISGAVFVSVPKEWLENTLQYLLNQPVIEVAEALHEASSFADLSNLPSKEPSL